MSAVGRTTALLYHDVQPSRLREDRAELTIPVPMFERQLRWLRRTGCVGVSAREWLAWLQGDVTLPGTPVVLTFDDAYATAAEHALPRLQASGFTATVFVVTGELGGTNSWDDGGRTARRRCMDGPTLRSWRGRGIELGAHTRTHRDLTRLDERERAAEVLGGAADLAELLGGDRVVSFAYPFGYCDGASYRLARATFDLAFTCDDGVNDRTTDRHRLRRTMVRPSDTLADFVLRLRLGWSPIERLRARGQLRTRLRHAWRRHVPAAG